jgi:bifunctional DNase/RNase
MLLKKRKQFLSFMLLWLLTAICCAAQPADNRSNQTVGEKTELIPVTVYQLVVDPTSRQPVVTLTDEGEKRALFIWIGMVEARAIYSELEDIEPQRPLTHDLLAEVILKSQGEIRRIVVTHTRDNTYFASIFLQRADKLIEIDARPSDALVLALKFDAPVYVSRDLFENMSLPLESRKDGDEFYGLSLQELTPDLANYLALESGKGAMVSGVQKGSRAAMDGLRIGDIIVEIEGRIVEDPAFFEKAFKASKRPLSLKVHRNNRFMTLTVHPE